MPHPPPWNLRSVASTRDFGIFRTRTLNVADPRDGTPYVRTVIDAPDWVNVVAITAGGEIVLVRQFRFGSWANSLEIPGGMVDEDEAPATAAARELEEETGFRPQEIVSLGTSHPNPAIFANRLHSYLARGCERVHQGAAEASEDLRVELVTREQLRALVLDGAITHSLVLATLLFESWRA
jgi:8-oxo-dGTP pyrophosphatase MutT (NUDIX family)